MIDQIITDKCEWCIGSGFLPSTGVMCKTCQATGKKIKRCVCGALERIHEDGKFNPTHCEKYQLAEESDHYP